MTILGKLKKWRRRIIYKTTICGLDCYCFSWQPIGSNMYVILFGNEALIIDACSFPDELKQILDLNHIDKCYLILTHEHYDHIRCANELKKFVNTNLICSESCSLALADPRKNGASFFAAMFKMKNHSLWNAASELIDTHYIVLADTVYKNDFVMSWQGLKIRIHESPGHSIGSQLVTINNQIIFTGDSVLPGEKIMLRMPGGDEIVYRNETVPYLTSLGIMDIYPGHGEFVLKYDMKNNFESKNFFWKR